MITNSLADGQHMPFVESALKGGATMPRGAEGNPLLLHRRIGQFSIVGGNKSGHIDQACCSGRFACQWTYFYSPILFVTHSRPMRLCKFPNLSYALLCIVRSASSDIESIASVSRSPHRQSKFVSIALNSWCDMAPRSALERLSQRHPHRAALRPDFAISTVCSLDNQPHSPCDGVTRTRSLQYS